ncbi:MAG: Dipeptide transport system permease protein DppC [Clostridia bacterium]|nr:Dipeptide transport system permease protein DppC [Clostridia bacterium]
MHISILESEQNMQGLRSDAMENITQKEATSVVMFKKQSQTKEIWRRYKKSKGAVIGLIMLSAIVAILLLADIIAPYEIATKQQLAIKLQPPSVEHIMGTDSYGRDVFARVIHGGRTSLTIAILATISSCLLGSTLGAISGFFGGKVDSIIMRSLDIFMSVPDILFTMAVVFALGANFVNLLVALTLAYFTNYVRLVRSQVLNLAEQDYVEAARAGGSGSARIIISHIIPNAMGVIIVNTTLNIAKIILYESTLSFLGLGMPPPAPEWGLMLSEAREFMRTAPHLLFFPALAIVLSACSVNLIGDGLRDALDPHLKS